MPKQLKVSLDFTANTDQAKRQIQDLSKALQQISLKTPSVIDDQQLKKAASAANELQRYLAAAVNVDTGKINLSEFSRQLDKSGRSLKDIYNDLKQVGPQGVSAFNKLSQSLVQAETQSNKLVKKMKEFGTTLANTARWQISSSILHGLQGAVQSAFYYAKDLDESLNNIRIVTGQNADQMARFAKEANAAAQSLSTTTTAYTNASLIYYQQGLNDKEVKERTDVTVKMANVTGESAQTISEQMTAVWNNFYDGSQSLESFSDKMVALGAATASSSSEISAGLNQFAATANTVGLSFDYAAAALATVTATTRQSANVVGNSFKTLFARLEGLSLGETLEDGTNLNKYSAALEKVGISIKDQNGELKAMDTILDELGSRWQTLAKDQQVALAQTVGGVRQYTQLIALMDNWDFMQENLQTVRGSEGALQGQQDIYAEGWQAAADRAKAALEGIYDTLIDDKKLKKLYDFGATALNSINGIIKGLGGIPGILTQIMSWVLQIQAKNMPAYLNNIKDGLASYVGIGKNLQSSTMKDLQAIWEQEKKTVNVEENPVQAVEIDQANKLLIMKQQLIEKSSELSNVEKAAAESEINNLNQKYEALKKEAEQLDILKNKTSEQIAGDLVNNAKKNVYKKNNRVLSDVEKEEIQVSGEIWAEDLKALQTIKNLSAEITEQREKWRADSTGGDDQARLSAMKEYIELLESSGAFSGASSAQEKLISGMQRFIQEAKEGKRPIEDIDKMYETFIKKVATPLTQSNIEQLTKEAQEYKDKLRELGVSAEELQEIEDKANNAGEALEKFKQKYESLNETKFDVQHIVSGIEKMSHGLAGLTAAVSVGQSLSGTLKTLTDDSANFSTKLSAGLTGATSVIFGASRAFKELSAIMGVTGGVIGLVLTAVSAAEAIISHIIEAQEEKRKKAIEAAEEELNKQKELNDSYKEALSSLNAIEEKYDENGVATSGYISQLEKLIDTYDIENGRLLLLQGNYEALENAIYAKIKAQAAEQKAAAQKVKEEIGGSVEEALEADDAVISDRIADKGLIKNSIMQDTGKTSSEVDAFFDKLESMGLAKTDEESGQFVISFGNIDWSDLEKVEELKTFLNENKEFGIGTDLLEALNSSDSNLNKWINAQKEINSAQIQEDFVDPRSLDTFEKIDAQIRSTAETLNTSGTEILSEATQYLGDMGAQYQGFVQKMTAEGIDFDSDIFQDYLQYFQGLSPEDKTLFYSIDLDPKSADETSQKLQQWKNEHQSEALKIHLELVTNAANDWKEGMSAEQINAWKEQYQDLFETEEKFKEFLYMDAEQRKDWLAEQITEAKPKVISAMNEEIEAMKARAAEMEKNGGLTDDAKAAKMEASSIEINLPYMERYGASQEEIAAAKERLIELQTKYPEILAEEGAALDALNQKITENQELSRTEMDLLASNAESFKQLDEWLQNGTIDTEAFNNGFSKLKNKLDEEIDDEQWKNLTKYLQENAEELKGVSKELEKNDKVAKRVSQSILRFDDAVQEISENYDDWMDALKSGNAQEAAEAAEEMRDTYADLLDLPFDTLSADFLQNAHNLELMGQVAEGSEEAYHDLQEAVRQDILANVKADTSQWEQSYNELMTQYNELGQLEGLEVGASLDNTDFLAKCEEMINVAGMTAEQATNFLASMGVDAEVEKVPVEETYHGMSVEQIIEPVPTDVSVLNASTGQVDTKQVDSLRVRHENVPYTETKETGAFSLKITSGNKSSGGGFKMNNATHGGGGGKKGGGGGGGGSKKTGSAEHAKKQPNDKAGNRYHVINNQIEDLAKQYDRLSEAEERAFGKSKLALMDQQKEKLEEQYKAQRELREEAERYWKEDLANLQNGSFDSDGDGKDDTFGASRYGMNVELDENGTILNYDQLVEAADAYYNAKVDAYNAWLDENYIGKEVDDSIEEEKKQQEEMIKNEEQYRENFLGLIDQYEDTQDKVQEELNKEIEAYHAVLDKMLEKTDYTVQLKLDVADDSLNLLNFLMNTLEDNAYRSAEAISNLQQQFNPTLDKYEANKTGLRDLFNNHFDMDHAFDNANADVGNNEFINKMKELGYNSADAVIEGLTSGDTKLQEVLGSMGDEFTEEEVGKFREYTKGMMDSVEDMLAIRQNMYKTLDDAIAQSNDDLDRLRDKIENASKVTEHWKNLIDLVGRDMAGMDTDTMVANEEKSLNILQAKVAADKDMMDEAQAVLDGLMIQQDKYEEGSNEWNEWKKRVEEAEDRLTEMTENYYSSWEEALEAVRTKFEKTIQWMGEDYSKVLGGKAGNLEGLQNLMDQYQKTHDTYVPEFERVYQLNKLNAEAIKAIDETNNIKAKKQLQEYQQQILKAQESGREMSEYELQNLEKELALRQAALALEESRNVKSQVRMQRDNEGNYSYVYTADEDAVADAENNYRDKLYEMQKANYEYINELQNNIVSLQQDYQQAIANAAETYGYGTEAYYDAVDKINSYYDEALKAQYDELNLAMKNNQDLQEFDKNFHAQMTHDKSVSDEGYITSFDQTLLSQLTGYETLEGATQAWSTASTKYTNGVKGAMDAYLTSLTATCTYAGTTLAGQAADGGVYPTFGAAAEKAFNDAKKAAIGEEGSEDKGLMGAIDKMAADAKEKLVGADNKGGLVGVVGQWVQDTVGIINGKEGESQGLTGALNNVITLLAGVQTGLDNLPSEKTIDVKVNVPTIEPINVPINYNYNTNGTPPAEASGGGGGGTGGTDNSTGNEVTGTGVYSYIPNNDNYSHTKKEKMSDGTWEVKNTKERCTGEGTGHNGFDTCSKCGQKILSVAQDYNTNKRPTSDIKTKNGKIMMDTGGYTGSWGDEGKLAILHEKELVLNKEDTANMLAAIGMIRQISDVIDLNAKSSGGAFSSLFAANVRTGAQELQQDVHITAEFPNATDHNEILEAFDNVINLASQYANRKVQPAYTSF